MTKRETGQLIPEARREGLVVQELSDEVLVYDRERQNAHCLNQAAALVWKQCDGTTSISQMAHLLEKELRTTVEEDLVWLAVDQLGKAHLLKKRVMRPKTGISRRDVVRRIGVAAAVAVVLPKVTSIVAPTPAMAGTCLGTGASCTTNPQCCSDKCVGVTCA